MIMIMIMIGIFLLLFFSCILIRKYHLYGISLVQYPIFWLTSLFVFYGVVPVLFYSITGYSHPLLGLTDEANSVANALSLYTASVFILFFSAFKFHKNNYEYLKLPRQLFNILFFIALIISIYAFYVLSLYSDELSSYNDRIDKFIFFTNVIIRDHDKLYLLALLECIIVFLLSVSKKSIKYYILLLPFFLFDFFISGRRFSILIFVPIIISLSIIHPKKLIKLIPFFIIIGLSSGLFRENISLDDFHKILITSFGEFNSTRDIIGLVYQKALSEGGLFDLLSNFIISLFPGVVFSWLYDVKAFTVSIKDFYFIGKGRGLSGNIVAESLYYGGVWFSIVSPLIIGFIYKTISESYMKFGLYGITFSVLLSIKTIWILRSEFYVEFANVLMTYAFYIMPIFVLFFMLRKKA